MRDLDDVLLRVIAASLAALPLGACGEGADREGLEAPFDCSQPDVAFEELRAAVGADSIEVRRELDGDGDGETTVETQTLVGAHCATATDAATCQEAVAAVRSEGSLFPACGGCAQDVVYLVATRGDAVTVVASREELLAWMGPVETPAEAWIVADVADYAVQCQEPWVRVDGGDHVLLTRLQLSDCPIRNAEVLLRVDAAGGVEEDERVELTSDGDACAGRRPAGLAPGAACRHVAEVAPSAMGLHLAAIARLEAASVDAFLALRDELAAHGAPTDLIEDAVRAAADEVRHAEVVRELARRRGVEPVAPVVTRGPVRDLEAIAVENAREGCVREAYGALEAAWQARAAADDDVREAFAAIAREESRHAALSMRVAAWLDGRLGAAARARVAEARAEAVRELARELEAPRRVELVRHGGLPTARRARDLLARLAAA